MSFILEPFLSFAFTNADVMSWKLVWIGELLKRSRFSTFFDHSKIINQKVSGGGSLSVYHSHLQTFYLLCHHSKLIQLDGQKSIGCLRCDFVEGIEPLKKPSGWKTKYREDCLHLEINWKEQGVQFDASANSCFA